MIFDYDNKTILVKIVYYGPAMSGKTTSLKYLFSLFGKEDEVESIESTVGRTLFFDFGVLKFKGTEWVLKFLLYSATGQDFYASTRPATLNGVDGIIFVIDAQLKHLERNMRSWNELRNIFGEEVFNISIVVALNKYDLEEVNKIKEEDFMSYIDLEKYQYLSFRKTSATDGKGVLESFNKVVNFIFPQLDLNLSVST
jgi:GTPase SAR1 family protein